MFVTVDHTSLWERRMRVVIVNCCDDHPPALYATAKVARIACVGSSGKTRSLGDFPGIKSSFGETLGTTDGMDVGTLCVGSRVGSEVGDDTVGAAVGVDTVGAVVGVVVGVFVVGLEVGNAVGGLLGEDVGVLVSRLTSNTLVSDVASLSRQVLWVNAMNTSVPTNDVAHRFNTTLTRNPRTARGR
jgi:hypothetical protein